MSRCAIDPTPQTLQTEIICFNQIIELAKNNLGLLCKFSKIKLPNDIIFSNLEDFLHILNIKCKKRCKHYFNCDLIDWSKEILSIYDKFVI